MSSIMSYTIIILIVIGIALAVKFYKNRNKSKEKDYISEIADTDRFESIVNKYLSSGYKLLYEEKENIEKEKDDILEYIKSIYFRQGHEIKSQYLKSIDEYLMVYIMNYYDNELYQDYELKKEGAIELIDKEYGTVEETRFHGAVYDENGEIKVDENGKPILNTEKINVPYTDYIYKITNKGIVKCKIYLSSLKYYENKRVRPEVVKEYEKYIDSKELRRRNKEYREY